MGESGPMAAENATGWSSGESWNINGDKEGVGGSSDSGSDHGGAFTKTGQSMPLSAVGQFIEELVGSSGDGIDYGEQLGFIRSISDRALSSGDERLLLDYLASPIGIDGRSSTGSKSEGDPSESGEVRYSPSGLELPKAWGSSELSQGREVVFSQYDEHAVRNDILEELIEREAIPAGLGAAMVDMVDNPSQDEQWREYVVQHFRGYYDRLKSDSWAGQNEAPLLKEALLRYVREVDNAIGGSALLVLDDLGERYSEISSEMVAQGVVALLTDETSVEGNRVTAMQIAGIRDVREVLPLAQEIAADESESIALRMTAVATVGSLQGVGATTALRELVTNTGSDSLRQVVARTIERIQR